MGAASPTSKVDASAAGAEPAVAASNEAVVLKRLFHGTWDELPRLLAGTVLFCLGFYLAAGAVPGITPISLSTLAIGVAPGFVTVDRGVWWLVPSMVVCAAVTVVTLVLAVAALPSAAEDSWPGTGAALRSAVEAVVQQPVPVLASLVLPAAAILVVSELAATLLLFFPAPAALVVVAARLTASLDAVRPARTLGSEGTTAP